LARTRRSNKRSITGIGVAQRKINEVDGFLKSYSRSKEVLGIRELIHETEEVILHYFGGADKARIVQKYLKGVLQSLKNTGVALGSNSILHQAKNKLDRALETV